jgi:hypothetical protein
MCKRTYPLLKHSGMIDPTLKHQSSLHSQPGLSLRNAYGLQGQSYKHMLGCRGMSSGTDAKGGVK